MKDINKEIKIKQLLKHSLANMKLARRVMYVF